MRIALGVEYDGSRYQGWQSQRSVDTVQKVVERALSRVAGERVRVHCSGRTDTGVHATGQVVHFDTTAQRRPYNWILGANVNLPKDVSVQWALPAAEEFHARFSALRRRYTYVIINRLARPAVLARRVAWVHRSLDADRMGEAAGSLLGRHDFSSFRARGCQARSPVRTVHEIAIRRCGEFLFLSVEADGFLQRMVRNIAGALIEVGTGRRPVAWIGECLAMRDRRAGGVTAPAGGLYLSGVRYPEEFGIPAPPEFWMRGA